MLTEVRDPSRHVFFLAMRSSPQLIPGPSDLHLGNVLLQLPSSLNDL